jgi:hypothetical protein
MKTPALQFKNLAAYDWGDEIEIQRISDGETLIFMPTIVDAALLLLEQEDAYYHAPKSVKTALAARFADGDIMAVYDAIARN